MAGLTQNIETLLDRLYNLKGDDNVILQGLANEIRNTESDIEETENNRTKSEINKIDSEGTLEVFITQKQTFEEAFQGLTDDTFSALRQIDINLEIGTLLTAIGDRSPKYCEELNERIKGFQTEIEEAEKRKDELDTKLASLQEEQKKAEWEREQLVSLLEQSLSPNEIERDSLTAHYVKKVLSSFGIFSETELSKLTKLIMFPDEGLYQYNQTYQERLEKGLVNPIDQHYEEPVPEDVEPEEPTTAIEQEEPAPIIEPVITIEPTPSENESVTEDIYSKVDSDDEKTTIIDLSALNMENDEFDPKPETTLDTAPTTDTITTPEYELSTQDNSEKDEFLQFLESIGLDFDKFKEYNTEDIETVYNMLSSVDKRVIEENYEILRSISLEEEAYKLRKHHMYIADEELNKKITLLRAKGISELKIQDLIRDTNSGLRETLTTLEERISAIEILHQKFDESQLYLLKANVARYEKNIDTLIANGYELDEKEVRNHNLLLFEDINIQEDVSVLKEYLIKIVKNNGKYALSVFWKKPLDLLRDIDSIIEADLENIMATNPEILGTSATELIKRVKYCEEHGEPIYEGNGPTEFCRHIIYYLDFYKKYGPTKNFPSVISMNEVNSMLPRIIGNEDYTEIVINTLEDNYKNIKTVLGQEIVPEMKDEFDRLVQIMEQEYHAEIIGKYTYKLGNICISKNKFERNLIIVLNALAQSKQSTVGVEREIILASALYNLRQDEETLRNVVGSCLGFNKANTLGGMTL